MQPTMCPAAFRLAGELKVHALEQSLNEIVHRHEILRTIFSTVNGDTGSNDFTIASHFSLACIDLSDRSESEREQALPSMLSEEAERPFDLSSWTTDTRPTPAARFSGPRSLLEHAPYRLRRMVDGSVIPRALGPLSGILLGQA